jgi:glycosyltransferase involved in cell wall biosynthesis
MVEVSVVIPTMNEEATIAEVLQKCRMALENFDVSYEIVVVDNSTDRTPEIAEAMGAKVLRGVKGYGRAYIEGFKVAKGGYIVMADADGSYDLSEIPALLEPLMKGEADIVLGSRFKGKIHPNAMPLLHRVIGNPILTWMINRLFGLKISDSQTGMRAFSRKILEKISFVCMGMEFASEMLIKAARKNLKIAEVPISYYPRKGESKLRSFRDGWRHLRFMLINSPTLVFVIPGITMFLLGIALVSYVLLLEPIRYHTQVLGTLLLVLGLQVFFFGISSKIYSVEAGLAERDRITDFFSRYSILEEGLIAGALLILMGFVLGYYIFNIWVGKGFGQLNLVNLAILTFVLITVGFQIIFNMFFISSLKIRGENDIG